MRLFGIPESEIARSLREIEADGVPLERLEITTCLRRGEIEIATVFEPEAAAVYASFEAAIREQHGRHAVLGRRLDRRRPGDRAAGRPHRGGGGVLHRRADGGAADRARRAPRTTCWAASSAYSNAAKIALADVPAELIERHGAVSPEVAAALADGARARFGADVGIGITGIAGPGGGTEEKPVGTVCLSVAGAGVERWDRTVLLPGDRQTIRERTTTVTMHGLRRVLLEAQALRRA